jgi:hypothetical protein
MTRKLAPFVLSTMLASLLGLAGCAAVTPSAVGPATPHPMIGFASPGKDAGTAERPSRFESDRLPARPMSLSDSWAR